MANEVAAESLESGKPEAEEAPAVTESAPPAIKITDLGAAISACEASEPEGWRSCITKELEARGYHVETEARAPAGPPAPEAEAAPSGEAALPTGPSR